MQIECGIVDDDCAGDAGVRQARENAFPMSSGSTTACGSKAIESCFRRQFDFFQFSHRALVVRVEHDAKFGN